MADTDITADFHCVTRWSRYDLHWSGVPFSKIMELVKPRLSANPHTKREQLESMNFSSVSPRSGVGVKFIVFHSFDKYTTNVTLDDVMQKNVIVATKLEGGEIPPEHGGPIRMILPHLYGWKSAKFLTAIEFVDEDKPGFWEVRGYSNRARPWIEERYSGD
ncbi:MAG: molybdopterin-dependent oxidoreductase, partial [Candidatus Sungbacteria bacterium]|nr:molybdopterin-dependent oxidoreductase [Candidatus Sungbacteria bacterium]